MSVNISSKSQQSQSAPDSEPRKLAKRLNWLMVIAFGLASEVGAGIFFVSAQVQGIVPGVGGQVPIAILTDGLIALFLGFTYWYFNPLFQVAVFAAIGWIVYSRYWRSVVEREDLARHKARFSEEPSI